MDDSKATPERDAEIVIRIAHGDREAEAVLWKRFEVPTLSMLRHRAPSADIAEDLWHDTFAIVLEKLRNGVLEEPRRLAGYVHNTALYVYIGWVRRERRRKTDIDTEITERFPASGDSPPRVVQKAQIAAALRKVVAEMTVPRDRDILSRYLRGETKAQICRELDLSETHHDRVISRARKRLAELLVELGFNPDDMRPWLDDE